MPLYLYICRACGRSTEALRPIGTESIACACGETSVRRAIYATAIGGRARPPVEQRQVSLRQFTEATEEMAYQQDKAEASAGQRLPARPLFEMAKRRAEKLRSAGITDSLDYRPEYFR